MRSIFFAVALCGLLCFGTPVVHGQIYDPYYGYNWDPQYQQYLHFQNYLQWQDYLSQLRQSDPYYQLHQMHYQLHLGAYDPNRYYPACCYVPSLSPFALPQIWSPYGARLSIR